MMILESLGLHGEEEAALGVSGLMTRELVLSKTASE